MVQLGGYIPNRDALLRIWLHQQGLVSCYGSSHVTVHVSSYEPSHRVRRLCLSIARVLVVSCLPGSGLLG